MKKPGILASILGANLVFAAVCLALLGLGWLFFTTGEYFWWLFLCLAVGHFSYKANTRVRAYRQWEREWQGMSGEGPHPIRLPRLSGLRVLGALAAWAFAAWFAVTEGDDPNLRVPVLMFWAGTAGLAGYGSYKWWAQGRAAGSAGQRFVRIVIARRLSSPSAAQTVRKLPNYCDRLRSKWS